MIKACLLLCFYSPDSLKQTSEPVITWTQCFLLLQCYNLTLRAAGYRQRITVRCLSRPPGWTSCPAVIMSPAVLKQSHELIWKWNVNTFSFWSVAISSLATRGSAANASVAHWSWRTLTLVGCSSNLIQFFFFYLLIFPLSLRKSAADHMTIHPSFYTHSPQIQSNTTGICEKAEISTGISNKCGWRCTTWVTAKTSKLLLLSVTSCFHPFIPQEV